MGKSCRKVTPYERKRMARFMLKPEALEPQTPGRAEAQIPGAELLGEIEFKMKVQDLAGLRSMGMRFEAHPVTGMPGLTFGKDLDVRGRINQGELRGIGALRLDKHTAKVELQELDNGYQLIVTDKPVGSRPPVETTVTIEAPAYTIENTAYRERTLRIAKKDGELWGLMNEATQEGLRVEQATGSARSEDYYRIVDQRGAVISSFKFDIWKDKSRAAVISEALTQLLARRALERQRQQE